jgi:hypothetical protein
MTWWMVLVLAACGGKQATPPPQNTTPPPSGKGLEDIASIQGLPEELDPSAVRDCRLSSRLRDRFKGARVKPCGTIEIGAPQDAAVACLRDALDHDTPFVIEQRVQGIDSGVAAGAIGLLEGGALVVYRLSYDSDPCGGGCPEDGHTTIVRCRRTGPAADPRYCAVEVTECFGCVDPQPVEDCRYGKR